MHSLLRQFQLQKSKFYIELITTIALVFSFAQPLHAESSEDWFETEKDWYQFELVLFKYLQPQNETLRYEKTQRAIQKPDELSFWYELGAPLLPNQHALIPRAEVSLSDAASYISRAKETRLIALKAWKQPLDENQTTQPFYVNDGEHFGKDVKELRGTVSVRRSRFIHADIELELAAYWALPYSTIVSWLVEPDEWAWPIDFLVQPLAFDHVALRAKGTSYIPYQQGRMKESRRLRQGERHYIDHPLFGVLISMSQTVSPLEAAFESQTAEIE